MQPALVQRRGIRLRFEVEPYPPSWLIEDDEKVPQSRPHHLRGHRIEALLLGWKKRTGRHVQVGRELALRWDEKFPRVGVDPDVYVVEPAPRGRRGREPSAPGRRATTLPLLAVEVVSRSRPTKDYGSSPPTRAAAGRGGAWIFDPGPGRAQERRRGRSASRFGAPTERAALDPRLRRRRGPCIRGRSMAGSSPWTKAGRWIADDEAGSAVVVDAEETERAASMEAPHARVARMAEDREAAGARSGPVIEGSAAHFNP